MKVGIDFMYEKKIVRRGPVMNTHTWCLYFLCYCSQFIIITLVSQFVTFCFICFLSLLIQYDPIVLDE